MYVHKPTKKPGSPLPTAVEQADAKTPAHKHLAAMPLAQQSAALAPPGELVPGRLDQTRVEAALAKDPELLARAVERLGQDPEAAARLAEQLKDREEVQRLVVGLFPPPAQESAAAAPGYTTASGFSGLTVNASNAAGPQSMNAAMMGQMSQASGVQQPQTLGVKVETDALEKAIAALGDVAKFVAWVAVKVVEVLGQAARTLVSALPVGWLVTAVAQTLFGTKAGLLLLPLLFL